MTNQHPLTDEICEGLPCPARTTTPDWMRVAADWQLEQVIEWLLHNLHHNWYLDWYLDADGHHKEKINVDYVVQHLREEMRPQEDN